MKTLKAAFTTTLIAGTVAIAGLAATSSPSQAMEIYNCTNDAMPVGISHLPSGRQFKGYTLRPGEGVRWNTGGGEGFRVSVSIIGARTLISDRNGSDIISINNSAGYTELQSGAVCRRSQQVAQPPQQVQQGGDVKALIAAGAVALFLNEVTK